MRTIVFIISLLAAPLVPAQTVAILDTGINSDISLGVPSNLMSKQLCFSETDSYTRYPASLSYGERLEYRKASMCRNGRAAATSNTAATHPRQLYIGDYPYASNQRVPLGKPLGHGNNMSYALYSFNRSIRHKHVQTQWLDSRLLAFPQTSNAHYCDASQYNNARCYTARGITSTRNPIVAALDHLSHNSSGISTVSIATTITGNVRLCRDNIGQGAIDRLYTKGIAVVASLANTNYPAGKESWPNCLNKVINVARTGNGARAGIGANGINYFALGTGYGNAIGNSFASPRVAAAFALLHQAKPNSTVQQKINALNNASSLTHTFNGYTRRYIRNNQINAAIDILTNGDNGGGGGGTGGGGGNTNGPKPPTPPGTTAVLGYTDDTYYRGRAKFTFSLNGTPYQASIAKGLSSDKNSINITDIRDIELTFQGKFTTAHNPASLQGVDIWVNGARRHYFHTINYAPNSIDTYNLPYRNYSYMLNRNWLRNGDNTIEIRQRNYYDQMFFAIKSVRMDYNPPIHLSAGRKNTKLYGHRFGSRRHLTGLRAEFASTNKDMEFTVTAYDIDYTTEIAVFLNQQMLGYLTRSGSDRYAAPQTFVLAKERYVSSGINTIEFVQTSSSDSEKWGIKDMLLSAKKPPAITGALLLLLGDD